MLKIVTEPNNVDVDGKASKEIWANWFMSLRDPVDIKLFKIELQNHLRNIRFQDQDQETIWFNDIRSMFLMPFLSEYLDKDSKN